MYRAGELKTGGNTAQVQMDTGYAETLGSWRPEARLANNPLSGATQTTISSRASVMTLNVPAGSEGLLQVLSASVLSNRLPGMMSTHGPKVADSRQEEIRGLNNTGLRQGSFFR